MAGRPTAAELHSLTEAFQRNPAEAFVRLGEAYLALGRPRDAIDVGALGLKANPASTDGRLMVARAFSMLHQWREAQAELLKVVKADRNHGIGFCMLGEVLMRRADYERAVPVLQHAQNLSPADPQVLSLLKRARDSEPLDPPPPIPQPMEPGGGAPGMAPGPAGPAVSGPPATVPGGGGNGHGYGPQASALPDRPPPMQPGMPAGPLSQGMAAAQPMGGGAMPGGPMPGGPMPAGGPMPGGPMPPGPMSAPMPAAGPPAGTPLGGPQGPPMSPTGAPPGPGPAGPGGPEAGRSTVPPGVRPRAFSNRKRIGAAQQSLRKSAAAGEQHLIGLLMAGLIDVPNVRVPQIDYTAPLKKKWGRLVLRIFVWFFVIVGLGGGTTVGWYWFTHVQGEKEKQVLVAKAQEAADDPDPEALEQGTKSARAALDRNPGDVNAAAALMRVVGLRTLLFGDVAPAEADDGIQIAGDIDKSAPAYRSALLGRVTLGLSRWYSGEDVADELAAARADVDAWLEATPEDQQVRWALGLLQQAAAERSAARDSFEKAHADGEGPEVASLALADWFLDEGEYEQAIDLYSALIKKSPEMRAAYAGRAMARAELGIAQAEAVSDVSVHMHKAKGATIEALKELAFGRLYYWQETFDKLAASLKVADTVGRPRLLARLGLLYLRVGDYDKAKEARARIRWLKSKKVEPIPLVSALDSELAWFAGEPARALKKAGKGTSLPVRMARGRALWDLRNYQRAGAEFEAAFKVAPGNPWVEAWALAVRIGDGDGEAPGKLRTKRTGFSSHAMRLLYAEALLAKPELRRDDLVEASDDLKKAVTDELYPNPLLLRSRVVYGDALLLDGRAGDAIAEAQTVLKEWEGYPPAKSLLCRASAAVGDGSAYDRCKPLAGKGAEPRILLAWARVNAERDRRAAIKAIRAAFRAGGRSADVARAIELIDEPRLFDELGIPKPKKRR